MTTNPVPEWWFLGPSVRERPSSPEVKPMTDTKPGRELAGVVIDEHAPIQRCKACPAFVWFGRTANGRLCPFDVIDGQRTAITHFSTCVNVRRFERQR